VGLLVGLILAGLGGGLLLPGTDEVEARASVPAAPERVVDVARQVAHWPPWDASAGAARITAVVARRGVWLDVPLRYAVEPARVALLLTPAGPETRARLIERRHYRGLIERWVGRLNRGRRRAANERRLNALVAQVVRN